MKLAQLKCIPFSDDEQILADSEIAALHPQVPLWSVVQRDGVKRLERVFKFNDYAAALAFTNRVAEAAQVEDHHPAILLEYDQVTVTWWTHALKGLHKNDFIMAAKTDELYETGT